MKIVVKYEHPPVPYKSDDFSAIDSDTYEGPGSKIGHGATEEEAVSDLFEQMGDGGCLCKFERLEGRPNAWLINNFGCPLHKPVITAFISGTEAEDQANP